MREWGSHFTCIAPDSPGFGQSSPLPGNPDIDAFASATLEFLDALGVGNCHAYGFHSGAIILAYALKKQPERFAALAMGGYPVWTEAEMKLFGERYVLPLHPSAYGEHLAWLWSRVLEQSWFFPWYDVRDATRMRLAQLDLANVQAIVMELLDAGDAYRAGYQAVLSAAPWVAPDGLATGPVFISAYDGDPLQSHIDRLSTIPSNWHTNMAPSPDTHNADCLAFLRATLGQDCPQLAQDEGEGFIALGHGLVHWRGTIKAKRLALHSPGAEMAGPEAGGIAIDVPGHGLSDPAPDITGALEAAAAKLGVAEIVWPDVPLGDPDQLYPDLSPQRFGEHLQRAWGVSRSEAMFAPWYAGTAACAIAIDQGAMTPEAIALRTRARLRAGKAARQWHDELVKAK